MKRLICTSALIALAITAFSQVPTEGLKGYYPFDGNANDESLNSYDGVVHGAVLATDRFGNEESAYGFDGINDFIELPVSFDYPERTYSAWFKADNIIPHPGNAVVNCDHKNLLHGLTKIRLTEVEGVDCLKFVYGPDHVNIPISLNEWYLATITVSDSGRYYVNDRYVASMPLSDTFSYSGYPFATIGVNRNNTSYMDGKIDDVRFYDRALSNEEIKALFTEGTCSIYRNDTTVYYVSNSDFIESLYEDSTITYYNPNGWCDSSVTFYSQYVFNPIYYTDTIFVFDTIPIYDSIAVTDTLIIDVVLTNINTPDLINTIKIYPNPAKDHIFINTGDYSNMYGYRLRIIDQLGKVMFDEFVLDPLYEVHLSTWSGKGLYYIELLDTAGEVIEMRKILLQ